MMTLPASFLILAAGGSGGLGLPGFLIQIALIFGIFYFLLIRPQSKQRQKHEESLRNLRKGDQVVTAGGLVGEVIHIREVPRDTGAKAIMEDQITIKSGESRIVVERGRIARIISGTAAPAS